MAYKDITYKNWDFNPQNTHKAELITKLTDLGSPLYMKNILGFYINYIQSDGNNASTSYTSVIRNNNISVYIRANTSDEFFKVAGISTAVNSNFTGSFYREVEFDVPTDTNNPDYNKYHVNQVQLKLDFDFINGGFSVNDFGLIYRTQREISTKEHDED